MGKKYYIELLDRFFQGLSSEKENDILRSWIKEPEAKSVFYEYYQQLWHLASDEMDQDVQHEIFSDILSKIGKDIPSTVNRQIRYSVRNWLRYAAVAACITLIVGVGSFFWGKGTSATPDGSVTMSVMNGQKADIVLADGTAVYINSGSKITYDNSYNKEKRILTLDGEAYFEVAHNKEKPFIVKANGVDVEALGTSFNVKAYKTSQTVSVILVEGKVKVGDEKNEEILNPNERLEYNLLAKSFEKSELHPNTDLLLWRSNELAFYGESLNEICQTLTHMYNWKFIFKSEAAKHYTFSGVIRNNSLENVLSFISQATAIKYEIKPEENTIVIYQK